MAPRLLITAGAVAAAVVALAADAARFLPLATRAATV